MRSFRLDYTLSTRRFQHAGLTKQLFELRLDYGWLIERLKERPPLFWWQSKIALVAERELRLNTGAAKHKVSQIFAAPLCRLADEIFLFHRGTDIQATASARRTG
jgi:hypothetical protein